MAERAQIEIAGIVQGVGFRPFIHALAKELAVRGFVSNTASGVLIDAEGERLPEFLERIPRQAPPLARIVHLSVTKLPLKGYSSFFIQESTDHPGAYTLVAPDVAVCADCLRELRDPSDRRCRYPFINCTNCGPRYSITRSVPYDRPNTTMASFRMCQDCEREYRDPADRRFHAQPNACPKCGPSVSFQLQNPRYRTVTNDPIRAAQEVMQQGGVVAIKGIGGFHLACDATNDAAVRTLRSRKRRSNKPFAVMAPSLESVRLFCDVDKDEADALGSSRRPIVLLRKSEEDRILSGAVSPNNRHVGVMLPYTPLHEVLFLPQAHASIAASAFTALVMTSGNLSEEPIVRDNEEARNKLGHLVDAYLLHDRDIFMRVDDSVVRLVGPEGRVRSSRTEEPADDTLLFLRRSRGYAPEPIPLPGEGPEVLGCGADLKNTFTLTKGAWAIPSQHIGDMENYETLRFFEETLANLKQVYRAEPVAIGHDLHPGYLSSRWAAEHAGRSSSLQPLQLVGIQHHYAHIGSVMAEHGLTGPVIGIAFDGTGYGSDGNLWGGEFLIADIDGFERVGQLKYIPLPGGEAAILEPWRTAASLVRDAVGDGAFDLLERLGFIERYGAQAVRQVLQVAALPELSPLASGAGRYFDAISAIIGLCDRNTFEGEAAMALESHVRNRADAAVYPVDYIEENRYTIVDLAQLVRSVLTDVRDGRDTREIATRFHDTIATVIVRMAEQLADRTSIREIAIGGGAFQNRYLLEKAVSGLERLGLNVYRNRLLPPNDASISLGQAYLVRERLKKLGVSTAERGT